MTTTPMFRVEVGRTLHHERWPWQASVYPLFGPLADFMVHHAIGETHEAALQAASEWIAAEGAAPSPETLYMDALGREVPAP